MIFITVTLGCLYLLQEAVKSPTPDGSGRDAKSADLDGPSLKSRSFTESEVHTLGTPSGSISHSPYLLSYSPKRQVSLDSMPPPRAHSPTEGAGLLDKPKSRQFSKWRFSWRRPDSKV